MVAATIGNTDGWHLITMPVPDPERAVDNREHARVRSPTHDRAVARYAHREVRIIGGRSVHR